MTERDVRRYDRLGEHGGGGIGATEGAFLFTYRCMAIGSVGRRGPGWSRHLLDTGHRDDPLSSHMTRIVATGPRPGSTPIAVPMSTDNATAVTILFIACLCAGQN